MNPPIVHDIQAIQKAIGHIQAYLMTMHAVAGCDTAPALFSHGKKKAFLLAQTDSLDVLQVFENHGSSKEDVTRAGKEFLLKLYGARRLLVQFKPSTNTVTHATTVPYVHYHPH